MVDLLPTVLGLIGLGERSWLVYNIDDTMLPNFLRGSVTQQKFQVRRPAVWVT